MISAKIIADSKNSAGDRITSFVCTFPRMILAEFNTHRSFSRNSASSRAIPFERMLEMVKSNPFIPIKWMKDHKGMQGSEFHEGAILEHHEKNWLMARDYAVHCAKRLSGDNVTKQIINRLLEPFMWHTIIVTATDFQNFFALRLHEAAEIHMQELARVMLLAYNDSEPKELSDGEWHIPFGDQFDEERVYELSSYLPTDGIVSKNRYDLEAEQTELKIKIATARCARISYNNFEGKDDYEADIKLHNRLLESGHLSCFEHCAKANSIMQQSGNFKGFVQYRKLIPNENRTDDRVIKK